MAKRAVLITGCSSGIGLDVALRLQQRGYRVFASVRNPDDIAALEKQGLEALHLDLRDSASIHTAVNTVLEKTDGKLYGLFNNGAYGQPGAVEDLSRDMLRRQFETNLFGWHELTALVIPAMRAQKEGRIIQNSSIAGFVPLPMRGAYVASKYALEGLMGCLRLELHDTGIHVSSIQPGPVLSKFRANAYKAYQEDLEQRLKTHPSPHQDSYTRMEQRMQKKGAAMAFTVTPEAVLKRVIHALESKRPQIYYYVTTPTYLAGFAQRILPARWLDFVIRHFPA